MAIRFGSGTVKRVDVTQISWYAKSCDAMDFKTVIIEILWITMILY